MKPARLAIYLISVNISALALGQNAVPAAPANQQRKEWAAVANEIRNYVMCLEFRNAETEESTAATGILVKPPKPKDGGKLDKEYLFLITNFHAVRGQKSADILQHRMNTGVAGMVDADYDADLAVLAVDSVPSLEQVALKLDDPNNLQEINYLPFSSEVPDTGDEVAVFGYPTYPVTLSGALSSGIVAATPKVFDAEDLNNKLNHRRYLPGNFIQVTAQVSPGSSGSPVLDRRGRIVGVVTSRSSANAQNISIPAQFSGERAAAYVRQVSEAHATSNLGIATPSERVVNLLRRIRERTSSMKQIPFIQLNYIRESISRDDIDVIGSDQFLDWHDKFMSQIKGQTLVAARELASKHDGSPLAHFLLAEALKLNATDKDAIPEYENATKKDKQYWKAFIELGQLTTEQAGNLQKQVAASGRSYTDAEKEELDSYTTKALTAYATACELRPNSFLSNHAYGAALLNAKNPGKAKFYLEKAYNLDNQSDKALYHYLVCLYNTKDAEKFRALYSRFVDMEKTVSMEQISHIEKLTKTLPK